MEEIRSQDTEGGEFQGDAKVAIESLNLVPGISQEGSSKFPVYNSTQFQNGEALLREMGEVVVYEYDMDLASRKEWEDAAAAYIKLFTSFTEKKNTPWEDASNVCLPLLSIATLQFHARSYESLIPSREVVKVYPMGEEDIPRADRVQKYMNYQLLYNMEGFEEGMDKSLMQLPLVGSIFRKTVRDEELGKTVSIHVGAADLVLSYHSPSLETARRISHVLRFWPHDINLRVKKGIFDSSIQGMGPGVLSSQSSLSEMVDHQMGVKESGVLDKPRQFIEQHRGWDLDGDGIEEPYIITVDYESRKVARITRRQYMDGRGRIQTINYFTHYSFFPNPEGFYGLGFGILIRHLNEAANTIVNEVIDAGTLANLQGGFVLDRSGIPTGAIHFQRGVYKSVKATTDDIRKAIFNFDFKGPNQTLYAVLGLLYEYSKLVGSFSETMTGQLPSSDTPASAVLSLLEEGRKVFSSIHKRIHRSFRKELSKIYRMNSIFLEEEEYFQVLGPSNIPQGPQVPIGRVDFVDTLDVVPVSDPTIMSKAEKLLIAQQLLQDVRTNPATAQNPNAVFAATRRYYEALGVPNVGEILQPPPPPPNLTPEEENAGFFLEKQANILEEQDHAWHLQIHQIFLEQEQIFSGKLTPEGNRLAEMHVQETISKLYLQAKQKEMAEAKEAVMGGGGPRMVGGQPRGIPGNPMMGGGGMENGR
jgi:chaperonin GroES